MELNSILNYYPCGAYELTKEGKMSICKLHNNVSQQGAGAKVLDNLYKKGYIENFSNQKLDNNMYLLVVFLLVLFVLLVNY
jgi:hypothetical protein